MSASYAPASEGLLALAAALDRFAGAKVESAGGEGEADSFWHLMLSIDTDAPGAWETVAELASIFNAGDAGAGGAVFKPVSLSTGNGGPGRFPYWTITHFFGSYSPADALGAVERYLAWRDGRDREAAR